MAAKRSDEAIPLKVLEMAILMVDAADQCDQAGQWDRDHRRACQYILDWYGSNDYKITCDKAGCSTNAAGHWIEDRMELICSECKWEYSGELPWMSHHGLDKMDEAFGYCPHCGARMCGPIEEEA